MKHIELYLLLQWVFRDIEVMLPSIVAITQRSRVREREKKWQRRKKSFRDSQTRYCPGM